MEMKKWGWLVFPGLVTLTVLFSSRWLIAGPDQIWRKLWLTGNEVRTAEADVVKLKAKLDKLNGVDINGQMEILGAMERGVPSRSRQEMLIWEMTAAASESGVAIERYGAGGSDETQQSIEATLRMSNIGRLVDWVENMERRLPLARIVRISYKEGRADVSVEQLWKEKTLSNAKAEDELPETREKVRKVMEKLSEFRELNISQAGEDAGGTNPNPF